MKIIILFLLLLSILYSNEDLDLEKDFLTTLDEVSEIATKTKLNIDDTPSFITVLHSNKLQKLGITNVFEALGLVPGVQLSREISGVPIVAFRGMMQKGEVKLMIDGVTINNNYRGSTYYYFNFPIELIQRIEVIRGSNSVLYGSGAISGVINIITKSTQKNLPNTLFISTGTHENNLGGFLYSSTLKDIQFSIDSYYHKDNTMLNDTDRHVNDYSIGLHINNEHFGFLGRIKKYIQGNAYGIFGVKDRTRAHANNENNSYLAELSYKNSLNSGTKITFLLGYNRYEQNIDTYHPIVLQYKEASYYTQLDVISTSFNKHTLLLGTKLESAKALQAEWTAPIPFLASPNSTRKTLSVYLDDTYSVNPNIDITAGVRYDNYSDFGDSFSPSFGVVYRATDVISLKALYSHAYRAPSWIELTSNSTLKAEKSDSIEAGLIYKQHSNTIRANFFASKVRDMITNPSTKYIQNSYARFYGSELEYIYQVNTQLEFNLLASYINAKDEDGVDLANVANVLGSSSLTYSLDNGLNFGSLLKYVSSSKREQTDTRADIKSSLIFDETISYVYHSISANLIIKDLFNRGTYYALPLKSNTNKLDFYDGGRTIMLKLAWNF
jgi:iron complex outermembrane receptor protein